MYFLSGARRYNSTLGTTQHAVLLLYGQNISFMRAGILSTVSRCLDESLAYKRTLK